MLWKRFMVTAFHQPRNNVWWTQNIYNLILSISTSDTFYIKILLIN